MEVFFYGSWNFGNLQSEKQTILSGGAVNLAGKVTKEILQSGTYSSGIMNKGSWDNCYMVTSSYYTTCSDGKHNHGEPAGAYEDGNCEAEKLSVLVITVDVICSTPGGGYTGTGSNESGTTPGGFNPSSGGGGSTNPNDPNGSNGSNNPNQPCGGNGVPSQPQDPNSTLGGNEGCNNGTVTLPNLGFNPATIPCEKAVQANVKAKALLEQKIIKDTIAKASQTVLTDPTEKGFNFGTKNDGSYTTSPIKLGTDIGINLPPTDYEFTVTGSGHTHNGDAYECFAPNDFYIFATANKYNANFTTMFTFGSSGGTYNVHITDLAKFKTFRDNYPKVDYITDEAWKKGSSLRVDFDFVKDKFEKQGKSKDEAFALAQAFVLKKYNTGMSISKKQPDGSFKSIFVKENILLNNPNKTTYEQTDECNL